jgi:tetratricopeptide (TPR) repeat protein
MGYAFKQLGQDDNAINCFRNAVNVNPEFKEGFVQLGQMFHVKGDTIAVVYYNNALQLDPTDEMTLYNKALFYQSIMDWNASLEAYADLHKVNFTHSSGHYNIGFIHMELGLYDVASNNFADAIYSNSEFFEAYYSRGNCFETLGNITQAEVDYKRAIEINPEYTFAVEALEQLQLKNKKYKK